MTDEPADIKQMKKNIAFIGGAADQMIARARTCMFAAHAGGVGMNLYKSTEKVIDDLEGSVYVEERWLGLLAQIVWVLVIESMGKSVTENP